jgi:hypothetical protein
LGAFGHIGFFVARGGAAGRSRPSALEGAAKDVNASTQIGEELNRITVTRPT